MGIALFASLGLPGLIGFPGEFLIFKGVFPLDWWAAALALFGLLMTAVFLLTIVQRVFSGPLYERWASMPALAWPNGGCRARSRCHFPGGTVPTINQRNGAWHSDGICRPGEVLTMLAWTIYLSFIGAVAVAIMPVNSPSVARITALLTTLAGLGIAIASVAHERTGQLITIVRTPWIPRLGIEYHLAADGISLVLILLTGIAAVAGVLFSWNIERRVKDFFALYLLLIGAVYGVFLSFDLFLLFVFYELAIIPKYFLIAIWGSTRREYAAMKLVLYSFAGSAFVLAGLIGAFVVSGQRTLSLR